MIDVKVCFNSDEEITRLSIKNHASNLICAGVSCCFVGSINAIEEIEKFSYQAIEGDSFVIANEKLNEHDKVVLETLYIQLVTIADKYPKEIKISRERV